MTNPVLEDAELEAGLAEQVANAKAVLGAFPASATLQSSSDIVLHTLRCNYLHSLATKEDAGHGCCCAALK